MIVGSIPTTDVLRYLDHANGVMDYVRAITPKYAWGCTPIMENTIMVTVQLIVKQRALPWTARRAIAERYSYVCITGSLNHIVTCEDVLRACDLDLLKSLLEERN